LRHCSSNSTRSTIRSRIPPERFQFHLFLLVSTC